MKSSSTTDETSLSNDIELLEHDNTENTTGKYTNKILNTWWVGYNEKMEKEAILKTRQYNLHRMTLRSITMQNCYCTIHGQMRMN